MSINIKINNAVKRYGDNTVIPNLSVDIQEGEFFTLLGPSGCGKTTLLRMIAGFNTIEGGDFYFDEQRINEVHPSKRNIGMVFQNYAIFPHLSVYENVAFGLKNQKVPKEEAEKRVDQMLDIMQIKSYKDRMPNALSGGQQQRVALARALVVSPDVLLMDEPLSNLDAKLRVEMRTAIKEIQRQFKITTIYVTHDQEEAMSVSDRIAVMNLGNIQQISSPQVLYHRPANLFVASFIGRNNVVDGTLKETPAGYSLEVENLTTIDYPKGYFKDDIEMGAVKISIRPEEFSIDTHEGIKAEIEMVTFLGIQVHYRMRLENELLVDVIEESRLDEDFKEGQWVFLKIKKNYINIFNKEANRNLISEASEPYEG